MSNVIVAGTQSPIQGPQESVWRKYDGRERIRQWTGDADAVRAMEASLRASGAVEVTISQAHGSALATIRARYANEDPGEPEEMDESLTIRFSDISLPINVHPNYVTLSDEDIADIKALAEDPHGLEPVDAVSASLFWHYKKGEDHYRAKLPVVTYTRTVSETSSQTADVSDAGTIYSPAQVASFTAAPIIFTIPTTSVQVDPGGAYVVGYMFDVAVDFLANGRVQIVETYEFGIWANDLYEYVA